MARVEIRVPDADLSAWKERASAAKLNLSDWIRWRCAENKAISDVRESANVRTDVGRDVVSATTLPSGNCLHDYGAKRCPFPDCQHYKWGK